jgi:NTP pyrophosphatase (non-canonical NTP hydrolase)
MTDTARQLAEISAWIDRHNAASTPHEALMLRTAVKLSEEVGEVAEAVIGTLGQNPRKGVTHTLDDVVAELLDVAVTALGAVESINGNNGGSLALLELKVGALHRRMTAVVAGGAA